VADCDEEYMSARARLLAAAVLVLAAGCANGERQVEIRANRRIVVTENGQYVACGLTATATLEASAPHTLTVTAEGCAPRTVTFTPRTSGGRVAAYVFECFLMPLGLFVLPAWISAGAFDDFDPDQVTLVMESEAAHGN
jgi:hypothetical protein